MAFVESVVERGLVSENSLRAGRWGFAPAIAIMTRLALDYTCKISDAAERFRLK